MAHKIPYPARSRSTVIGKAYPARTRSTAGGQTFDTPKPSPRGSANSGKAPSKGVLTKGGGHG